MLKVLAWVAGLGRGKIRLFRHPALAVTGCFGHTWLDAITGNPYDMFPGGRSGFRLRPRNAGRFASFGETFCGTESPERSLLYGRKICSRSGGNDFVDGWLNGI